MIQSSRPLAVVTGASSGIGLELAKLCVENGHDLVVAADDRAIHDAARTLRSLGAQVDVVEADLSTTAGNDELIGTIGGRAIALLLANAGHGLGHAFLDQPFEALRHVIDTNVTGTLYLLHVLARRMVSAKSGRILVTGSIAGFMPGTYQAVYNATKSFIDQFSYALRAELAGTGVTVTCLMPGATETEFFERADLLDTKVGAGAKADPAEVAKVGFDAMMRGDADVVAGWQNKLRAAMARIAPPMLLAEQHRKMAEPGSASENVPER